MKSLLFLWALGIYLLPAREAQSSQWSTQKGQISFISDAPLEMIRASSDQLQGLLDLSKQSFAFSVKIGSLEGFNSPLQREHFNENYLESDVYPSASFSGKLIDRLEADRPGTYEIRAKGMLQVHGVKQERIIKGQVMVKPGLIEIKSQFSVLLEDHQISIPRIVHQKIAEEIQVRMHATLLPTK